ncbi:statherin isoform a precursor, partial [Daubentonia madagascariensis]
MKFLVLALILAFMISMTRADSSEEKHRFRRRYKNYFEGNVPYPYNPQPYPQFPPSFPYANG